MVSPSLYPKVPIIICEGGSEATYLTYLNRLLVRSNNRSAFCKPVSAGNGYFSSIKSALFREMKKNRKSDFHVWVDRDIYVKNSKNCMVEYERRKPNIPVFWFTTMNFEDFLMLHEDRVLLQKYEKELDRNNHFDTPLESYRHETIFSKYIPSYKKGSMPFELTKERMNCMFNNMRQSKFKNDFALWLENEINSGRVNYR